MELVSKPDPFSQEEDSLLGGEKINYSHTRGNVNNDLLPGLREVLESESRDTYNAEQIRGLLEEQYPGFDYDVRNVRDGLEYIIECMDGAAGGIKVERAGTGYLISLD